MADKLIPLPNWIVQTFTVRSVKFKVQKSMKPLYCSNCGVEWYPRIERDGEVKIPGTCPVCRTKAWRKKR